MEKVQILLLNIIQSFGGAMNHHMERRLARALLSQFGGCEIDPDEFHQILDTLEENDFVEINRNDKSVRLTSEGTTALEVGTTDTQARIAGSMIKAYQDKNEADKERFVNEMLDAVCKETQYFEKRIQELTKFDTAYVTNGFLARIKFRNKIDWLTFSSIAYVKEKDFIGKLRLTDQISRAFENVNCLIKSREQSIDVILFEPSDWEERIRGTGFQLSKKSMGIDPLQLDKTLVEFLVLECLKEHFCSKGLIRIGNSEKFVDLSCSNNLRTLIGTVKCFEGFNLKLEVRNDVCIVWIDPSSIQIYTLLDCVRFLQLTYNEKEITERLLGAKVHVLPKRTEAFITDISYHQNMDNCRNFDYVRFWKSKYNISIERSQALISVSFGQTLAPLPYPSDTIYLDKNEIEKRIGYWKEKEGLSLAPDKRFAKTRKIIDSYISNDKIEVGDIIEISIIQKMPSWIDLTAHRFLIKTLRILPPNLVFSKDMRNTSFDPRAIFKFGPYAAKRDVSLWKVFVPMDYSDKKVQSFVDLVSSAYSQHQFGRLLSDPTKIIQRLPISLYEANPNPGILRNIIKDLPKPEGNKSQAVILVIPDAQSPLHDEAKVIINEELNMPDQLIKEKTFERIANGDYSLAKTMALQVFIKCLKNNEEVPWILSRPSDAKGTTVYVGFGFSREPTTGKEANSFFAVCDSVGKSIIQKTVGIPFNGRYIDASWTRDFFGSLKYELEKLSISKFQRLVVYRAGTMYKEERDTLTTWLGSQKGDQYWGGISVDFISVKPTIERILKTGDVTSNPETGICVIVNENEALMSTSSIHERRLTQGTVIPMHITKENETETRIEDIAKEYLDRTYLNWMAPITGSKWALQITHSK